MAMFFWYPVKNSSLIALLTCILYYTSHAFKVKKMKIIIRIQLALAQENRIDNTELKNEKLLK